MGFVSATGLATTLVDRTPAEPSDPPRPLNAVEAGRLATMRWHNYRDGRVGLHGTLGRAGEEILITGWIDWQRPLAYLAVSARQPGPADGLVQAVPGTVAVRPGRIPLDPGPPAEPPADGWRVRPTDASRPEEAPLDTVLQLLFTIAADQKDKADLLADSEARWLGTDTIGGVPVDVLLGPAVPPRSPPPTTAGPTLPASPGPTPASPGPAPASPGAVLSATATLAPRPGTLAEQGGAVRYWLDLDARLRRLEAVVSPDVPVRLDFERADQREADHRELQAISELGGAAITPRRLTATEAQTLSRLRQRSRALRAATLALRLPGDAGNLITAAGWLDWRYGFAYVALRDTDTPSTQTLLRADQAGVAVHPGGRPTADGQPPPPPLAGWTRADWVERAEGGGASDLDLLLSEALGTVATGRDDPDVLRATARWLRADRVAGTPVGVYELPRPSERRLGPGHAKLRYWVDGTGALRRLEVHGRSGGFGRLDLTPGRSVPYIPPLH
jgi:hypothetical protein